MRNTLSSHIFIFRGNSTSLTESLTQTNIGDKSEETAYGAPAMQYP